MILEVFDMTPGLTPISVFTAAREHFSAPGALLESAMTDDHNHFSLIAFDPVQEIVTNENSFEVIKTGVKKSKLFPQQFPFSGGLIGYFNFEIFDEIEPAQDTKYEIQNTEYPHAIFYEFSRFYAFDHAQGKIFAIQTTSDKTNFFEDNENIIARAQQIHEPVLDLEVLQGNTHADFAPFESEQTEDYFVDQVAKAKELIRSGEIFQMILSNGWKRDVGDKDGLDFYAVLRKLEPTTHLVFYDFGEHGQVCGASPEILGSKRGDHVTYSPIAGTRYRGNTPDEDESILQEMIADPKENAEHDMLVDLGRNDLGKVCEAGSIVIEREKYGRFFANVMHLVSDISGELKPDFDAVDFFAAIFPAGTLSGAPKIRAIKTIREFEPSPRRLYGGAMGYFSADGNMEFCIAIRTFFLQDGIARFRCGAGIVQDSVPKLEWKECHNKAKSLCKIFNYVLRKPSPDSKKS